MKAIKITILLLFLAGTIYAQNCCESGGCYIRLDDISGVDTDKYQDSLQAAACRLVQAFPEDFRRDFRVYDFGFYLHNENFDGSYPAVFEQVKSQIDKPYYLLFGKQTDSTGVYSKIIVELKLPPKRSLSTCFTEKLKNSLETTLQRYVDNEHDEYTALKWNITEEATMEYLESKIYHIVNCCVPPTLRDPNQTCSWCFTQFDDAMSMLENDGYFDFGNMLEYLYGQKLNIAIDTHSYTKINSSYQILFKDEQGNYEYNFTDALEYYKENYVSSSVGLDINVKLYDDIPNDILCYGDDNTSAMPYVNSTSKIEIVVLNYHKGVKVYAKADVGDLEIPKNTIFLINSSDESNSFMHPIINTAIDDCEAIWTKNGFEILEYEILQNEQQFNAVIEDDKNFLYHFIKPPLNQYCPQGHTEFKDGLSRIFDKTYDFDGYGFKYGSIINISRLHYKNKKYEVGFALAHELAHAYSMRGLRLLSPFSNLTDSNFLPNGFSPMSKSGHYNYSPNLLFDWRELDSKTKIPKPSNTLTPYETMNKETSYLIAIFVISTLNK